MKIIVYSDVHGNKYALEQLQNTEDYKTADKKIFLGDAVSFCAYPNECIEMIKDSKDDALIGNHDFYCAYGIDDDEIDSISPRFLPHLEYIKNITSEENKNFLKSLPKNLEFEAHEKKFHFCHFVWETETILADNPDGKKQPTILTAKLFKDSGIDADYVFFGHNHTPNIVEQKGKTYVCVGSLGVRSPANYVLVTIEKDYVLIEPKKLEFDVERLTNEMIELDYPNAKVITNYFSEN